MKKKTGIAVLSMTLLLPQLSHAGKVDDVKKAIKDKCNIELKESQVMDVVVKVFDCNPDTKVQIENCTLQCMKSSGAIVGGGK